MWACPRSGSDSDGVFLGSRPCGGVPGWGLTLMVSFWEAVRVGVSQVGV